MSQTVAPPDEALLPAHDRQRAVRASGRLGELNKRGILEAVDVHVAGRLGRLGGETDEDVLLAVAVAVRAVRNGSTCVDLASAGSLSDEVTWPDASEWCRTVSSSPLARQGVVRLEGSLLYLTRYWEEESQIVADLLARDRSPAPSVDDHLLDQALSAHFGKEESHEQRAAARSSCARWTSVVTGGPGTGKTTTVARLLGVLLSLPHGSTLRIALAAPTGKAAARMGQALREATDKPDFPGQDGSDAEASSRRDRIRALEATTLHRLLGWRSDSSTRFRHDRRNRLPYDVVVVDESSMVSSTMMARLLEAVRPGARLVLVGDAEQLASVEAGAVLGDIVRGWAEGGPVISLAMNYRFGRNIRLLADAIRRGDADSVVQIVTEGRHPEAGGEGTVLGGVAGPELDDLLRIGGLRLVEAATAGDVAEAIKAFEAHRLLCAHREGPHGVTTWNRHVERLLMESTGQQWLDEWYAGRPFIVNRNDRGLRLWNGDTGVACVLAGRLSGVVGDQAAAEPRLLATTRLAEVSTAHAMTVHRSQGSQFDEVTVVLPEPGSRILTRELLYTAVTRARSVVRVVGSEASIRAAVERRALRATGLADRLSRPG